MDNNPEPDDSPLPPPKPTNPFDVKDDDSGEPDDSPMPDENPVHNDGAPMTNESLSILGAGQPYKTNY